MNPTLSSQTQNQSDQSEKSNNLSKVVSSIKSFFQKIYLKFSNFKLWIEGWKQFSAKHYKDDFIIQDIFKVLIPLSVICLLKDRFLLIIDEYLIKDLLEKIESNQKTDICVVPFIIIAVYRIKKSLSKHLLPTLNSIVIIILLTITWVYFLKTPSYICIKFHFSPISSIPYISVFAFCGISFIVRYKSYLFKPDIKANNEDFLGLIEDTSNIDSYEDMFFYTTYAKDVSRHLLSTNSSVSFNVAVSGKWGSGKSDFLRRLKKEIDNQNTVTIDFNPWRVSKADAIVEEFYVTLAKELKLFDYTITNVIKEYSEKILKSSKETHYKFIDALLDSFYPQLDLQGKFERINKTILSTGKKFFIFIDDLDRLNAKEITEVLKLIRNSASFSNTFFIVGYDYEYVVDILSKSKEFSKEEEYLKKIFQINISLPLITKDSFLGLIKEFLNLQQLPPIEFNRLGQSLDKVFSSNSIQSPYFVNLGNKKIPINGLKILGNIRDIKRFCNSFKIAYNILKNEVELNDLIVLELLKNSNITLYEKIRNFEIVTIDKDKIIKNNKFEGSISETEAEIISYLTDGSDKGEASFFLARNFYIYFSYQLFNNISIGDFRNLLSMDSPEPIKERVESWISEDKEQEFLLLLGNIKVFQNSTELKNLCIGLLQQNRPQLYAFVDNLLVNNWYRNLSYYFEDSSNDYIQFLTEIIGDNSISLPHRINLSSSILNYVMNNLEKESYNQFISTLKSLIVNNFQQSLQLSNLTAKESFNLLLKCAFLDESKDNRIFIREESCTSYRDFLISNPTAFEDFLKEILVTPIYLPYDFDRSLKINDFVYQIFSGSTLDAFIEKLQGYSFRNKEDSTFIKIIIPHLEAKQRGLTLNEDDHKFIETYLKLV